MTRQPDNRDTGDGYPAEKARQGRIVLNTPARVVIFIAGLAGIVVMLLFLGFTI